MPDIQEEDQGKESYICRDFDLQKSEFESFDQDNFLPEIKNEPPTWDHCLVLELIISSKSAEMSLSESTTDIAKAEIKEEPEKHVLSNSMPVSEEVPLAFFIKYFSNSYSTAINNEQIW
jgi:hypothetical protein